jgi:hypothetical protein
MCFLLNEFWKGHVAADPREKFGLRFARFHRLRNILVFVSMTIVKRNIGPVEIQESKWRTVVILRIR